MINYTNSLLADIAYINFEKQNGIWTPIDTLSLEKRRITDSEIKFFNENFEVINQENSSLTGFSAITYRLKTNNVPGYKAGDIIVAYRGTEFKTLEHKLNDILYTDGLWN